MPSETTQRTLFFHGTWERKQMEAGVEGKKGVGGDDAPD